MCMKNVALHIGADPFTFNDLDIVKKSIDLCGFINIFLDRKNRDAEYKQYLLNYADRSDIIKHDLKAQGIVDYKIIPIDKTFEKAMYENDIHTLFLNFDYQANTDFRMMKVMQYVNPNLNIMLLRGQGYIEKHFIKTLLDSDSSLSIYKKFCSDYAFTKLKIKTMKKIGLTGLIGSNFDACIQPFKDKGYEIIDVEQFIRDLNNDRKNLLEIKANMNEQGIVIDDISKESIIEACAKSNIVNNSFQKFIYSKVNFMLGQKLKEMFSDKAVIIFGMMCEFGMQGMMDKTICIECDKNTAIKRLIARGYSINYVQDLSKIQMDIEETKECSNFIVKDDDTIVNQIVKLLNTKLKC